MDQGLPQQPSPNLASSPPPPPAAAAQPEPTITPSLQPANTAPTSVTGNINNIYPDYNPVERQLVMPNQTDRPKRTMHSAVDVSFDYALTFFFGVGSSIAWLLVAYYVKKESVAEIAGSVVALMAIYFAYRSYRNGGNLTPAGVIGLSAATITLLAILEALIAKSLVSSTLY